MALVALVAAGLGGGIAFGAGVVTVTSPDGLNLRSGPSTQAQVLAVVPLGSVLTLSGDPTGDGWYPVTFGSASGWAYGAYLTAGELTPTQAAAAAPIASAPALAVSPPSSPTAVTTNLLSTTALAAATTTTPAAAAVTGASSALQAVTSAASPTAPTVKTTASVTAQGGPATTISSAPAPASQT
ncbi:MAG TPA: SH3 domain-containing protein, partial [Dehalococcoidia bacterium]|nr:SH3 domain-containing protein [Dehalococcoidia bacterium]